jgi:hypothetical protein
MDIRDISMVCFKNSHANDDHVVLLLLLLLLGITCEKQKWSEYWNRSILRVLVFRFMRRPGRGGRVGVWSVERLAKY